MSDSKFDICDGRNQYRPCPSCLSISEMGLVSKDMALAVQCMRCGFRGPGVKHDAPGAQRDKWAFDAWNDLPRAGFHRQLYPSERPATQPDASQRH